MATSPELQRRIDTFVLSLQEEFGEILQGEHDCLLSAIEDFGRSKLRMQSLVLNW